MTQLGIIVALPGEKKTLPKLDNKPGYTNNHNTLVCLSGMGSSNANRAANKLIASGCEALMSWGCAAALTDNLFPGDCLLPDTIIAEHSSSTLAIDQDWHNKLNAKLSNIARINTRPLIGSDKLITSTDEKYSLGAHTGAVGLDMESAAIADVASKHNIPFVIVRCVADPVSMSLPESVAIAMTPDGGINILKLLLFTARHPSNIRALIHLAKHFKAAQKTLAQAAKILQPDFCMPDKPRKDPAIRS